jgi:CBS domain containing-hemolysin-like protein
MAYIYIVFVVYKSLFRIRPERRVLSVEPNVIGNLLRIKPRCTVFILSSRAVVWKRKSPEREERRKEGRKEVRLISEGPIL